ncbi:MAG TPA: Gmad2 immunoglobulin-like domain-containing protein, partial [Candidatus Eisenbacteria bacterium]|nr:Gmad2 immunoglobulin-like domain-containing protein [Candidatus Eisenbacteria bacterium]
MNTSDNFGPRDEDALAARLRRALAAEAAAVHPSGDGLARIREGIAVQSGRSWWRHPALALAAAAVIGVTAGGLAVALSGDDHGNLVAEPDTRTSPPLTQQPSHTTGTSQSPTAAPQTGDVFVYYVHDDGQRPRLYREQHRVTAAATSPGQLAVLAMLGDQPADPDYSSPWPVGTQLLHYTKNGATVTVDLSGFVSQGGAVETAGVQQLVYTVTANDRSATKVRLLVDGRTPQGHADWSAPVARAPMIEVQGLIWLLAPTQGATVSSPVGISGFGTAFEGTISWEVRQGGVVVRTGHTQGGSNGTFGEFHDTVSLPPGSYELRAFEVSAQD